LQTYRVKDTYYECSHVPVEAITKNPSCDGTCHVFWVSNISGEAADWIK